MYGGEKAVFPPGYPALLAALLRAGLAHPWVIVGLNMVFLAVGLFAAYSVLAREFFQDRTVVLMVCSFSLLSYVVIKHSTLPLTDVPFFCFCMGSLAVMSYARKMDSGWRLGGVVIGAALLAVIAMMVRTIGAALFPPLVFVIVTSPQLVGWLKGLSFKGRLVAGGGAALAGGAAALMLVRTPYWRFFIGGGKGKMGSLLLQTLFYRVSELGEVFVNCPLSKLPARLHVAVPPGGVLLILLVLLGLWMKRRRVSPSEVFLVCYVGVLVVWPYSDARYWLPVIPLLIAYAIVAVKSVRLPKAVVAIYCVAYAALGFGVIAYSTRITFAGAKFPDRYGDGRLRPTYCAALRSCEDGGEPDKVDAKVLRLLQEYN